MRPAWLWPVLVAALTAGCAAPSPVDVWVTDIAPMPSTLFEQRARLGLRVQNLGEAPIEATGVQVKLRVNGRMLAQGVDGASFSVPRLGDTTTSIVVSSTLFDTIKQLLALQGARSFAYALVGDIYTARTKLRFKRTGELSRADLEALAPTGLRSSVGDGP